MEVLELTVRFEIDAWRRVGKYVGWFIYWLLKAKSWSEEIKLHTFCGIDILWSPWFRASIKIVNEIHGTLFWASRLVSRQE